ncbi:MAG: hypothetical protein ACK449_03560 [Planctomycetota bacterium]|jgi:hypothetical protein
MSNLESLVQLLIREGHWSDAAGLVRDELGVTHTQAEARVVALAEELGISSPSRWHQWFAVALAGCVLLLLAGSLQWFLS